MINDFYTILQQQTETCSGVFFVELRSDCQVYRGHFPEKAISPGVCSIQMIKECGERVINSKISFRMIKQCRFTLLLSPADTPRLTVYVSMQPAEQQCEEQFAEKRYNLESKIMYEDSVALTLKGIVAVHD